MYSSFDGDPARYSTGRQKVILATMTMNKTMKTSYTSVTKNHPAISTHWRKFKRWAKVTALHADSNRLKRSDEFTTARQRISEDPSQFYLRLFDL
jgi:hypothetical protein